MREVNSEERAKFIMAWFRENSEASVLNKAFHDDYHRQFPDYKRKENIVGTMPVEQAMKDLKDLSESGELSRKTIGLGSLWQPGFPKWIYLYCLPEEVCYRRGPDDSYGHSQATVNQIGERMPSVDRSRAAQLSDQRFSRKF